MPPPATAKDTAGHSPELCSRFHRASELIGRRWTGAIIFVLLKSRCRFATLRDAVPEITDRMLSERLQELEQEGIVRVEYALTRKGRALASTMDAIADWAHKWIPARGTGSHCTGEAAQVIPASVNRRALAGFCCCAAAEGR